MKQQELFKKMYFDKTSIKATGRYFPVMKPRTCRNCYFYDFCIFPQKLNPKYKCNDFENPQNRYEIIPDGYCVPVKYFRGREDDDYPGYFVDIAIDKILNIFNKQNRK